VATEIDDALDVLHESAPDVLFLDYGMAEADAHRLTAGAGLDAAPPEIIAIALLGGADEAERALKAGAWHYAPWPESSPALLDLLEQALSFRGTQEAAGMLASPEGLPGIVGESFLLLQAIQATRQAAQSDANVLLLGETGTGKELFASALHGASARAGRSFVVVDCASLPDNLVESTLFGHEKGAFTGADRARTGLIAQADGGTLFLDEVAEMPMHVQKSFLRVLQEGRFRTIGGDREYASDFRIVSASNRNLDALVDAGEFRQDLLFRIRGFTIEIPPLRQRPDDVDVLIQHYVPRICDRMSIPPKHITPEYIESARRYPWPGNVRELIHSIERSVAAARTLPALFPVHLPIHIRIQLTQQQRDEHALRVEPGQETSPGAPSPMVPEAPFPTFRVARARVLAEWERSYLEQLLKVSRGLPEEAVRLSGLSRSRLYALLKRHGLSLRNPTGM
jgi:two-component system NtrC family response regulator